MKQSIEQRNLIKRKQKERDKILAKTEEIASLESMANSMQILIQDKRYEGMKFLLTSRLEARQIQRNRLTSSSKNEFEYIKNGIICDTEINLLTDILQAPENFVNKLSEIETLEKNRGNLK